MESSESAEVARSQAKHLKAEEILENALDGVVAGVVNLKVEDSDESMSEDILKELTTTVRIEEDSLAAENLTAQMIKSSENDKPESKPEVQKQAVSPTVSLFLPPEDDTGSPDENKDTERDPEQGMTHYL